MDPALDSADFLDDAARAARESTLAVLARHPGRQAAREAEPLGHHPKLWADLCAAGLPGLAVDAADGGGAPLHGAVLAAAGLGAVLSPVPFAEQVAAAELLAASAPGHPDLAAVVSRELIATLAPRVRAGVGEAVPAGAVAGLVLAPF